MAEEADFASFLAGYTSVILLHGPADDSFVAARHLTAALQAYAPRATIRLAPIPGSSIGEQLRSLVGYLKRLDDEPTDMVASGGYKAFAVSMGHAYWQRARSGWRLFYLHESDMGELVREWGEAEGRCVEAGTVKVCLTRDHLE